MASLQECRGPLEFIFFHQGVVFGHRRSRAERIFREGFHVLKLQERIEPSLVSDRAVEPITDVGAARRSLAMSGIDDDAVRQLQIEVAKRVKLLFGELLGLAGAKQVGTAGGVDEEGIPRDHPPRECRNGPSRR